MSVRELRSEILENSKLLQILLAFRFRLDMKSAATLSQLRSDAEVATARPLRDLRDRLEENIRNVAAELKCRHNPQRMRRYWVGRFDDGLTYGYVPKYVLETMFAGYSSMISNWDSRPAHVLIGFDFRGQFNQIDTFEFILPEAVLCEDMCLAYNMAVSGKFAPTVSATGKVKNKTYLFSLRSALLSAFYFLEAYLNGIAFDFLIRTKGSRELSKEEEDKLTEWDSVRKRERWVSFRDKILQYPKIILNLKEPLFTETNCEELRILLDEAREFRDSLVHNSPRITFDPSSSLDGRPVTIISSKVKLLIGLSLADVTQVVDAAIHFIKKLNGEMKTFAQPLPWLFERDSTGAFPEEVFK